MANKTIVNKIVVGTPIAKVVEVGFDSADVIGIVDSDYVQARVTGISGGGGGGENFADSGDGLVVYGPVTLEDYIEFDGVKISSSVDSNASIVLRSDSSGYVGIGIDPQETIQSDLQVGGSGITSSNLEVTQTVILSGLPTSDPSVSGQLWNDSGVLKISAG